MVALLALFLAALAVPQSQPPRFRAVLLESDGYMWTEARGINERGESVGTAYTQTSITAARWDADGKLTVLGRPSSPDRSWALGINNAGVVVGGALHPIAIPVAWPPESGGYVIPYIWSAYGLDVNESGTILLNRGESFSSWATLLDRDGSEHTINYGYSGWTIGLTDSGIVVGTREIDSLKVLVAFRWTVAGGFEYLRPASGFGSSAAFGIAQDGTVAGMCGGDLEDCAALWDPSGRVQLLPYSPLVSSSSATAYAVNSNGWAVGNQYATWIWEDPVWPHGVGTLWVRGKAYELDGLVDGGLPGPINWAIAINERGQILGGATVGGVQRSIRLDPIQP